MKELFHFVDLYHQLPEELLLKWAVRGAKSGAVFLVFDAVDRKRMFGWLQDPRLTVKQAPM